MSIIPLNTRSYPGKESATGEYTKIIFFIYLVGLFGAGNELVYPYYQVCFLNPGLAYLVKKPL